MIVSLYPPTTVYTLQIPTTYLPCHVSPEHVSEFSLRSPRWGDPGQQVTISYLFLYPNPNLV